jgi:hypothetical protein
MASVNSIYPDLSDETKLRIRKMCVHAIAFLRLNPYNSEREEISGLVESAFEDFDPIAKAVRFNYKNDVIELYSDREVKHFRAKNTYLYEQGLIQEFDEEDTPLVDQTASEDDVLKIAALPLLELKRQLAEMTSMVTIRRVRSAIESLERPDRYILAVDARLAEVEK